MKKKSKIDTRTNGIVFSTDPSFSFERDESSPETVPDEQQKLIIRVDTKQRAGKSVTLVQGFFGKPEDLELLGKKLKNYCGSGGSVKDGEIIIQGDQRDKVFQWLVKNGYGKARKV